MLIELFKVLFLVFSTVAWRMMPNDLPPWYTVYQQTQRWLTAGVFEAVVHDLRALLRLAAGRELSNHRQRFSMAEQGIPLKTGPPT